MSARDVFNAHWQAAGLHAPPFGALAGYAEDVVGMPTPGDPEEAEALGAMQQAAYGLLDFAARESHARAVSSRRASAPAAKSTPAPHADRAAVARARYRRGRS